MFSGVAPFPIIIAKNSSAKEVYGVELGRDCCKYAVENVKRNKLADRVKIVQGDVRKVVPKLNLTFDRIVMARPNLIDSFLDVVFKVVKKRTMIHYYGFYHENEKDKLRELILSEASKFGLKVKILRVVKAGDIGARKFRYRADIRIL